MSDTEIPLTWLEQQQMKLRAKREGKRYDHRTMEEKQLVSELKNAQSRLKHRRALSDAEEAAIIDQYAFTDDELSFSPNGPLQRARSPSPEKMPPLVRASSPDSARRRRETTVKEKTFVFRTTSPKPGRREMLSPEPVQQVQQQQTRTDKKKSDSYYVSGLERPPFTNHQTKYVFSISPPRHEAVSEHYIGAVATKPPLGRASAPASPLIPQRSSSKEAVIRSRSVTRESGTHGRSTLQRNRSDSSFDREHARPLSPQRALSCSPPPTHPGTVSTLPAGYPAGLPAGFPATLPHGIPPPGVTYSYHTHSYKKRTHKPDKKPKGEYSCRLESLTTEIRSNGHTWLEDMCLKKISDIPSMAQCNTVVSLVH